MIETGIHTRLAGSARQDGNRMQHRSRVLLGRPLRCRGEIIASRHHRRYTGLDICPAVNSIERITPPAGKCAIDSYLALQQRRRLALLPLS